MLMGVLNATPDSFSDGGQHNSPEAAIEFGSRLAKDGADLVDVGGESTRPGSSPVSAQIELERVLPVVRGLSERGIPVSVDTMKAEVAATAIALGAKMINDVSALRDPDMASVCATGGVSVCLMHMQGTPKTMQQAPQYDDVVSEVCEFLLERATYAESQGISKGRIWIDPGIGFGKTDEHNFRLLRNLDRICSLGYPVLLGVSRKGFIGRALPAGNSPAATDDRLEGTLAIQSWAQLQGVHCIRVHDVRAAWRTRRMIDLLARPSTEKN